MTIDRLVGEFFEKMGAEPVACDDDGVYRFEVDGLQVSFFENGDFVHFVAAAGAVPEDGREALYRELLTAMFPGEDSEQNVLSLMPDDGRVCLYRKEPVERMELPQFCEAFGAFSESLMKWRDRLANYTPDGDAAHGGRPSGHAISDGFMQV